MPAPPTRPASRAFFCPECGQAIRPPGLECPSCHAGVVLPPQVALELHSQAEELVAIQIAAPRPSDWTTPSLFVHLGARIIDLAILSAIAFPLLILLSRQLALIPLAILAAGLAWEVATIILFGGTPGMRLMGLRLIDHRTEAKIDPVQTLLRVMGWGFIPLTIGLSALATFAQPQRRAWHDLLAGTRMVAVRQEHRL